MEGWWIKNFFLTAFNFFISYFVTQEIYSHCLLLVYLLFRHYFLNFSTLLFELFHTTFLLFYTTFWAYSQGPLKLRLNASSRHGNTLPSVFSINKKKFAFFWQRSIFAPRGNRTRIAESADQWLTHYTIWAGWGCYLFGSFYK